MPFQTLVVENINKWDFDRRLVVPFGSWREQQWSTCGSGRLAMRLRPAGSAAGPGRLARRQAPAGWLGIFINKLKKDLGDAAANDIFWRFLIFLSHSEDLAGSCLRPAALAAAGLAAALGAAAVLQPLHSAVPALPAAYLAISLLIPSPGPGSGDPGLRVGPSKNDCKMQDVYSTHNFDRPGRPLGTIRGQGPRLSRCTHGAGRDPPRGPAGHKAAGNSAAENRPRQDSPAAACSRHRVRAGGDPSSPSASALPVTSTCTPARPDPTPPATSLRPSGCPPPLPNPPPPPVPGPSPARPRPVPGPHGAVRAGPSLAGSRLSKRRGVVQQQ
jgi:hypothetical protein